jgi:hypothetical protein
MSKSDGFTAIYATRTVTFRDGPLPPDPIFVITGSRVRSLQPAPLSLSYRSLRTCSWNRADRALGANLSRDKPKRASARRSEIFSVAHANFSNSIADAGLESAGFLDGLRIYVRARSTAPCACSVRGRRPDGGCRLRAMGRSRGRGFSSHGGDAPHRSAPCVAARSESERGFGAERARRGRGGRASATLFRASPCGLSARRGAKPSARRRSGGNARTSGTRTDARAPEPRACHDPRARAEMNRHRSKSASNVCTAGLPRNAHGRGIRRDGRGSAIAERRVRFAVTTP